VLRLGSATADRRAAAPAPDRPPGEVTVTALLPAVGSVALAAALGSPVLAALGLLGLLPLVPRLARRLGGRRRRPPDAATITVLVASDAAGGTAAHRAGGSALAVSGPREAALGVARARVGAALLDPDVHLELAVAPDRASDWDWCRWLGDRVRTAGPGRAGRPGGPAPGAPGVAGTARTVGPAGPPSAQGCGPRSLLVVDGAPGSQAHRWWADRPERSGAVVVVATAAQAPAWCEVVEAPAAVGDRGSTAGPLAGRAWADDFGRRLAAGARRDALPPVVPLADLVPTASVTTLWGPARGLAAPIGVHAGGVAWLDLADGPHALVAGTTGAGKSELLQTLVLSLALHHPPERLALVLVDFKGGAGLGPCRDLPHVLGEVTDLDPAAAERALAGVRAELRRREALLAAAGVTDLEQLRERGTAPPRLVVVVDELRALREDLPDVLPALIRLSAQGRSLGIHLVLATQRPAGALDAQVRANVAIRVCLRVTDVADSLDVLDEPGAAALPADRPGRALVRVGAAPLLAVQTAWAGAPGTAHPVRWVSLDPPRPAAPGPGAPQDQPDAAAQLVSAIRTAAAGHRRPAPLWRPPLPAGLSLAEVDRHVGGVGAVGARSGGVAELEGHPAVLPAGSGPEARSPDGPAAGPLTWGLVDRPEEQRTDRGVWDPASGPLLVAGPPGSGRTTALCTVVASALAAGLPVHVLHAGPGSVGWLPRGWDAAPALGTVVGADDPRRVVRLLDLLGAAATPALLVVDGVAAVQRACDLAPRGVGDVLAATLRHPRAGLAVACGGLASELARFASGAGPRLVLGAGEDGALVGLPAGRRVPDARPGQGVVVTGREAAACQVAVAPPAPATSPAHAPVVRLAPLPATIRAADLGPDSERAIGVGGDDAGVLPADLGRGLLVVGPPRSGRTTALRRAVATTRAVEVASPTTGRDVVEFVERWRQRPAPSRLLVLDDVDVLVRDAGLEATLTGWAQAAEAGEEVPRVLVAARTDRAATAWSGLVAALRASAPVLVLGAASPGSSDAAGHDLARLCDPVYGALPGRGVLVDRGAAVPLQVAR
jgi:S-DNA-T family DNA segregation ATPase FtsK/SpoIIIE